MNPDDLVRPRPIHVSDEVLHDLRDRLARTRWPEPETVEDHSQGVPLEWLQDACDSWAHRHDWRIREAALNDSQQLVTTVDGLDLHLWHARSPHAEAMPLLLTHGWPGSVVEFTKVVGPLTDPTSYGGRADDAFHVVAPSLPGFGFSERPRATGWGVAKTAEAWAVLMARLGYDRYVAHGGDWGSAVTTTLGALDPDHCAGIHLTLAMGSVPPDDGSEPATSADRDREERALARAREHRRWGTGYSTQQSTRPQTIGYALTDSPAGLAGWVLEKFWAWTDRRGAPLEQVIDLDLLLDNLTVYWATSTAASSARLYWESFRSPLPRVGVPTGVAAFPGEIVPPVRRWMESSYTDIRHWTEMPRGGHFAALEQPDLLVTDLRTWFGTLR